LLEASPSTRFSIPYLEKSFTKNGWQSGGVQTPGKKKASKEKQELCIPQNFSIKIFINPLGALIFFFFFFLAVPEFECRPLCLLGQHERCLQLGGFNFCHQIWTLLPGSSGAQFTSLRVGWT
jgi:hypothetical protein